MSKYSLIDKIFSSPDEVIEWIVEDQKKHDSRFEGGYNVMLRMPPKDFFRKVQELSDAAKHLPLEITIEIKHTRGPNYFAQFPSPEEMMARIESSVDVECYVVLKCYGGYDLSIFRKSSAMHIIGLEDPK